MSGENLKTIITDLGVSQSEIARRLNLSQAAFAQMLKVADVKSGLLERIAQVLGKDMSMFYGCTVSATVNTGDNSGTINAGVCSTNDGEMSLLDQIAYLRRECAKKDDERAKLLDMINKLIK